MTEGIKTAFTLAEVLITLGIIGVVAAMTIPGLMTKIEHIKLQSQFKKAHALIAQMVKSYNNDDERTDTTTTRNSFYKAFMKYFNTVTDCGDTSGVADDSQFCMIRQSSESGSSKVTNTDKYYTNYSKTTSSINTVPLDDGQFYLNNGMLIMFDTNTSTPYVSVDVNGKNAKPNAWGHDLFTFYLEESEKEGGYELFPMGDEDSLYPAKKYCSKTGTSSLNGIGCAYKAVNEQDYFKNLP